MLLLGPNRPCHFHIVVQINKRCVHMLCAPLSWLVISQNLVCMASWRCLFNLILYCASDQGTMATAWLSVMVKQGVVLNFDWSTLVYIGQCLSNCLISNLIDMALAKCEGREELRQGYCEGERGSIRVPTFCRNSAATSMTNNSCNWEGTSGKGGV